MRIFVGLDNGLLPDRFGKHAPEAYQLDGHPVRSFPIEIADVPEGARSLALTFLDYDAGLRTGLEQRLVASGRQPYRPADHPSLRGPVPA